MGREKERRQPYRRVKMKNLICPKCNGELKLRNGKNGAFYGCANYPRCRFTMPYHDNAL